MALTIKTPASTRNLTTLSAVRDALRIADDSSDAYLTRLIAAASDAIERYCNRIFARQTYIEMLKGADHPILMVGQTPIISITSVLCEGDPIVDYSIDDADVGTLYRDVGWVRGAWVGWGVEPAVLHGTEAPLYTVEYQAGYILPGQEGATLPASVEEACIVTCSDWHMKSAHGLGNVKSKKVGDLSIEYQQSAEGQFATVQVQAVPAAARALLSTRVV